MSAKFVFVSTLDDDLEPSGSGIFKLKDVSSVWFNKNNKNNKYSRHFVKVYFNDGDYDLLDMDESKFMEFLEAIEEAELD